MTGCRSTSWGRWRFGDAGLVEQSDAGGRLIVRDDVDAACFERPWSITLISSEKASASSRYWVVSGTATSERSSSTEA